MQYVEVNGTRYLVKKKFQSSKVKNMELLGKMKFFYGADTIILDNNNNLTILADSIKEAEILEETINE